MASHLVLLFGLLCAGVLADWDFSDRSDSDDSSSTQTQLTGVIWGKDDCNACLKIVFEMNKMGKESEKVFNQNNYFYPCPSFTFKENAICRKVEPFVKENLKYHNMSNREICASANYCTKKYKPKILPLVPQTDSKNKDWSGRRDKLSERECGARKDDKDAGPAGLALTEPSLDFSGNDPRCQKCKTVVNSMKTLMLGNEDWEENLLVMNFVCQEPDGTFSNNCIKMLSQNGYKIIQGLKDNKSSTDICASINECPKPKFRNCEACKKYVFFITNLGLGDGVKWACMNHRTHDKDKCKAELGKKISKIDETRRTYPDLSAHKVCEEVQMCLAPLRHLIKLK